MAKRESLPVNELVTPTGTRVLFGTAAPTVGTYKVGDIVINTTPSATGAFAWSCSVAGTPGTWNEKGSFVMPDGVFFDFSNAAVAAAGAAQATYAVLADQVNAVTGADGTKGVALPAASAGRTLLVINTSQTAVLPVAPLNGGNDQINSLTAGTGVFTMGPARAAWFVPTSATQWYVTGDAAIVGTPTEQDMDGLTATTTELNYLDITALGTGAASKAVVLDAGDDYTWPATGILTYGVLKDPAATTILATGLEINRACDVSTRVVNCTTGTLAVTEADHDGKTIVLDLAGGIAVTLPVAAPGLKFRFIVKTTFTGAASIKSVAGTDIMIGHALMGNDTNDTVVDFQSLAASTNDTIDLFGTANSTGGIEGEVITIEGLAANLWHVEIRGDAAGTEATPFSNTVA